MALAMPLIFSTLSSPTTLNPTTVPPTGTPAAADDVTDDDTGGTDVTGGGGGVTHGTGSTMSSFCLTPAVAATSDADRPLHSARSCFAQTSI